MLNRTHGSESLMPIPLQGLEKQPSSLFLKRYFPH